MCPHSSNCIVKGINMNSIKDMVKDGKKVKFMFYKQNELWYTTECGFEFPVPIEDCGDGVFLVEDKAMLFMRYIRKHIKYLEDAKKEATNPADFPGGPLDCPEDFDSTIE
jgi:hypothetical protein